MRSASAARNSGRIYVGYYGKHLKTCVNDISLIMRIFHMETFNVIKSFYGFNIKIPCFPINF